MQTALITLALFAAALSCGGENTALGAAFRRIGDCRAVAAEFTQTRWLKDLDMEVVIRGSMVSEKTGACCGASPTRCRA